MATKTVEGTNYCTFQWKVEKVNHYWLKKGDHIASPTFLADALNGTKWSIWLYPMGYTDENNVGVFLKRETDSTGITNLFINYQLAFLDEYRSCRTNKSASNVNFKKLDNFGFPEFESRQKVFVTENTAFLPEDTLTVQCTIWRKEEKPVKSIPLYSRTVFKENRRSFVLKINIFSIFNPEQQKKFRNDVIDLDVCLNEEQGFEKKLDIHINSFDERMKYLSFKASIVYSVGDRDDYGNHEYFAEDLKVGKLSTQLFTKKSLEKLESRFLSLNILLLDFEYIILSKTDFYESGNRNGHYIGEEKTVNTAELLNDLKNMYMDALFSDVELRTSTGSFSAHKNILSARSVVFRSMFSHDMKEKNCGYVDITDLKDDTVLQMLQYIYTESLGDLQFENVSDLYAAADKYQILSLKSRCASFLKENLCPTSACDVLLLADLHNDDDLKSAVDDYILGQKNQFFCSQEWKRFMNKHLKLAADVMYRRIFR